MVFVIIRQESAKSLERSFLQHGVQLGHLVSAAQVQQAIDPIHQCILGNETIRGHLHVKRQEGRVTFSSVFFWKLSRAYGKRFRLMFRPKTKRNGLRFIHINFEKKKWFESHSLTFSKKCVVLIYRVRKKKLRDFRGFLNKSQKHIPAKTFPTKNTFAKTNSLKTKTNLSTFKSFTCTFIFSTQRS